MNTNGQQPAFPMIWDARHKPDFEVIGEGFSKREAMAVAAMQGLCASGFYTNKSFQNLTEKYGLTIDKALAISSVSIADALLLELSKPTTNAL